MTKDFKNKILNEIEKKDISPKPKWQFLLKDYFVWALGGISIFVGGIAFSLITFVLMNSEWESYRYLSDGFFEHIVKMAPYLWFLVLGGFVLVADYNFSNTKKGYKYSVPKITVLSISLSIILGSILYQTGLAHIADHELAKRLSFYQMIEKKKEKLWNKPEEGLLIGKIIPSPRSDILILEDVKGLKWEIEVGRLEEMDFTILDNAEDIVLVGYVKGVDVFDACMVKSLKIQGESRYLRQKMHQVGLSERKNFVMRNNGCERGTTSPRAQLIKDN